MSLNERIAVAGDEELELSSDEVRLLLLERARKLAQSYAEVAESGAAHVQLITFSRGAHKYAVELRYLTEIRPLTGWTPIPGVPAFYEGVIQVRGEIIALVDITTLFEGAQEAAASDRGAERFAVVLTSGATTMALLADTVDDVHDVRPDRIHPPLATFTSSRERYLKALVESGPAVVDVEKLLGDERLWVRHDATE
jgi:purine-binding chemotaxis protein CheW